MHMALCTWFYVFGYIYLNLSICLYLFEQDNIYLTILASVIISYANSFTDGIKYFCLG